MNFFLPTAGGAGCEGPRCDDAAASGSGVAGAPQRDISGTNAGRWAGSGVGLGSVTGFAGCFLVFDRVYTACSSWITPATLAVAPAKSKSRPEGWTFSKNAEKGRIGNCTSATRASEGIVIEGIVRLVKGIPEAVICILKIDPTPQDSCSAPQP